MPAQIWAIGNTAEDPAILIFSPGGPQMTVSISMPPTALARDSITARSYDGIAE